ncbi:hypothetical protein J1605_022138 [Eschrichtius robustus]|uniref:Uncharacterized protein n=1 Tax=Eschrichtius robustus TaxID=9764 RepID=A0AB34H9X6_ESCRO|nr:hypothetical protein J1605_022138 [Eschrichtius robustus]
MTQRLLEEVCSAFASSGRAARPSVRLSLCPLRARRPRGEWARRRVGPSVAWARRDRPRAFLAREESAAGALREQLAARWPAGSAESWGRSLARPPRLSHSLAFCAATLPEPFGEPRRPAPAPRRCPGKVCVLGRAGPWRLRAPRRRRARKPQPLGGSWAVASPKEGGSVRAISGRPRLDAPASNPQASPGCLLSSTCFTGNRRSADKTLPHFPGILVPSAVLSRTPVHKTLPHFPGILVPSAVLRRTPVHKTLPHFPGILVPSAVLSRTPVHKTLPHFPGILVPSAVLRRTPVHKTLPHFPGILVPSAVLRRTPVQRFLLGSPVVDDVIQPAALEDLENPLLAAFSPHGDVGGWVSTDLTAQRHSAEVLSSVSKCKKAVMCLM